MGYSFFLGKQSTTNNSEQGHCSNFFQLKITQQLSVNDIQEIAVHYHACNFVFHSD